MFTGIISALGKILEVQQNTKDVVLWIQVPEHFVTDVRIGDSISINGVCLTVTQMKDSVCRFDVSPETLAKTTVGEYRVGDQVNLEKALRFGATLDGHLVAGHVDGVGVIQSFTEISSAWRCVISVPRELRKFLAVKGSITVDGVSLTINELTAEGVVLMLIPHTLAVTTLKHFKSQQRVNVEIDLIARYVERLLDKRD
jgi:riboflavin synthase